MGKAIAVELMLAAGVALLLGLFGPFGTFAMPISERIAYWVAVGLIGYAVIRPIIIIGRWLSDFTAIPTMVGVGLALFIAALPMTFFIALLMPDFDMRTALAWPGLPALYVQVWLVGFSVNGFFTLVFRNIPSLDEPVLPNNVSSAPQDICRLTELETRLPAGFGPLLAIKAEDHYVRIFGPDRSLLMLMRLADAVELANGMDGMRVHRSWWVVRAAVSKIEQQGRRTTLILSNGERVPVSREAKTRLKTGSWLSAPDGSWGAARPRSLLQPSGQK